MYLDNIFDKIANFKISMTKQRFDKLLNSMLFNVSYHFKSSDKPKMVQNQDPGLNNPNNQDQNPIGFMDNAANAAATTSWTRKRLIKLPNGSWTRVGRLRRITYVF